MCVQILGEGKPENQNHAMIFCFGECVQTVDMNQENRHAEALKMRCARLAPFSSPVPPCSPVPRCGCSSPSRP